MTKFQDIIERCGKHYIINLAEDKSLETRAEYNKILTNIFLTDAEIDTGIKSYEI